MNCSKRGTVADMKAWMNRDGAAFLRAMGAREGDCVLDFGSGPGGYVLPLVQVVGPRGRVVAVDKDPRALSCLRERVARFSSKETIEILQTEGELTLDGIEDASLDVVLLFDVLQHVQDWALLFANLHRTLVSEGLLLVNPSYLSHPGRVNLNRLESMLTRCGFTVVRRTRARVAHYDRLREEEILVCRAQ